MFKRAKSELAAHYLLCGALSPWKGTPVVLELLDASPIDWDTLMAQAHRGRVLPQLFDALSTRGMLQQVPQEIADALEGFFVLNVELNTRLRAQMLDISKCLSQSGIPHVWLKGATALLTDHWHKSPRTMLDLDLWIPDRGLHARTFEQLFKMGFVSFDPDQPDRLGQSHHYPPLVRESDSARLEFHAHLVSPRYSALLPDQFAQERICWQTWQGMPIGVLSPIDQAMHSYVQCVHMNGGQFLAGQVTLMKIHDFVTRLDAVGSAVFDQQPFTRLQDRPWQLRARMFLSYLEDAFGLELHCRRHRGYINRLHYPVVASAVQLQDLYVRGVKAIRRRDTKVFRELPQKLWRNVRQIAESKRMGP